MMREGDTTRAVALLDRMLATDPLRGVLRLQHAEGLTLLGRYEEAERDLQKLLALQPDYVDAQVGLATLAIMRGDPAAARRVAEQIDGDLRTYAEALALAAEGDRDGALAKIAELEGFCAGPCYWYLAEIHALLNDETAMYAALEQALVEARASAAGQLPGVLTSPILKRCWSSPRFQDFARRNGTPVPLDAAAG